MPPTFLFVIGLILYLFLVALTLLFCVPLLFLQSRKAFAKKAIGIMLISLPCLLFVTFILMVLLALPGALFLWIINAVNVNDASIFQILMGGMFVFALIAAISSLYLWYFSSRLLMNYIDKKALADVYDNDKVYQYIKQLLTKFGMLKLRKSNFR